MANKYKVVICGKEYTLTSEDNKDYTVKLAAMLDKRIKDMKSKFKSLSASDCAILTALDCMDELAQANRNIDNIRTQIKDYVDDAGRARTQSASAQREIMALKEKVAALEKELEERTNFTSGSTNDSPVSAADMLFGDIGPGAEESPEEPEEYSPEEVKGAAKDEKPEEKKTPVYGGSRVRPVGMIDPTLPKKDTGDGK